MHGYRQRLHTTLENKCLMLKLDEKKLYRFEYFEFLYEENLLNYCDTHKNKKMELLDCFYSRLLNFKNEIKITQLIIYIRMHVHAKFTCVLLECVDVYIYI